MRAFLTAVLLIALAGCGAGDRTKNDPQEGTSMDNATLAKLSLTSDAFKDGQPIPAEYTCDGAGRSPALSWGEPPPGTGSFALVVDDPDAPGGTFRHWGVFDIPATERSIGAGVKGGTEASNDFGKPGYGGPCPAKGHGPHRYRFKLFALDVERLDTLANPRVADVETAARKHAIAEGELIGTYDRR